MALAPYFKRSAQAAAQVLAGFDEAAIQERLEGTSVGLSWGKRAVETHEGRAALDLTVRLLARLYPRLRLAGPDPDGETEQLLLEINPDLELIDGEVEHCLHIGRGSSGNG